MAKYYHFDIARWEAEGGAPEKTAIFSNVEHVADRDRRTGGVALWRIACGIAILIGSLLYARQKGWV
jgi:hypothetical protein